MESISYAARRSSLVYDTQNLALTDDRDSETQLIGHTGSSAGRWSSATDEGFENKPQAVTTQEPLPLPQQPFYKRRWFIISQIIMIPLGIAMFFILLFPVVKAIVKLVLSRATLDIQQAIIKNPQNNTFDLELHGLVYHTGIIPAKIMFTEPTQVYWIENSTTQTYLGSMQLHDLSASSKRAVINDTTSFQISDEDAFGRFSGSLITSNNFTWRLVSNQLKVRAASFPISTGLSFDKQVIMKGFDSFDGNVILQDLQLPQDNPGGGIDFAAVTQLNNPSPFSMNLGTVVFSMAYKNVSLGVGTGTDTIIAPGNNTVTLKGTLLPHTSQSDLAVVSELFTNYLNSEVSPVIATGLSTQQGNGSPVSWLSQGLTSLTLTVPFKPSKPIDPIRSITIDEMALQFDQAWTPGVESHSVRASLELPFGFGVSISQIQNTFMISNGGLAVAGLQTPIGASNSSISTLSATDTVGSIDIAITNTRLSCPDSQHSAFSSFNKDLTVSNVTEFRLIGQSQAYANTSIGQLYLNPIKVNVSTTLNGLQGLKGLTTIQSVDVTGGTTQGLQLGIGVNIMNPSSLNLSTGDLTLHLSRSGVILGTATMPNLVLQQGNNRVAAVSTFEANNSPQGLQTLNDFVGKKDVDLTISGYDGSTQVASLSEAFQAVSLDVVLPALKTDLLSSASLTILPTTGRENNISHVAVTLNNPFSAAFEITKVSSSVSYEGIPLGSIEQVISFEVAGNSTAKSPDLNLDMNFDPAALFTVTRSLAVQAGLDVTPLDAIVKLGGYSYLQTANTRELETKAGDLGERQANVFKGFDLTTFVKTAFKQLKSNVQLTTGLKIGDYETTIQLSQSGLPTATDDSLALILPILAAPIVQKIVGGSTLGLDSVLIIDPQQTSFQTQLNGNIGNAGPFDATISFPSGLVISWEGKPIGTVAMGNVQVVGDVGASISTQSNFQVADVDHLADFTKTMLTTESFDWDISGTNLTVEALGISVSGITLPTRTVTLKGMNGLKNDVKIATFDLPSNDPAGGIHLDFQATTTNPSQVGIQLSSIAFDTYYDNVLIAPVASSGQITLAPSSTTTLSLAGRLIPQTSDAGLAAVSEIFTNFIHGQDSNVVVQGASAGSSDVTWLNDGFRALQVATVLPNRGPLDIMKSISLNELTLMFTPQSAFGPVTSSKSTDAAFTLPFAFPIDIVALQQTIVLGYQGTDFGQLSIPKGPSQTDVQNRIIHLSFNNVPLQAYNNQHGVFEQFLTATTIGATQTVHLSGSADADASTAVGLLSLKGISFAVDTAIAGLQGLVARPVTVSNLDVNHGYPDYLLLTVDSNLYNPSNLTIGTGDVSFGLEFQEQTLGSADLSNLVIVPGNASYNTGVHYSPQGGAVSAGLTMLQNFLQGIDSEVTIAGSQSSTQVESLQDALSHIRLSPVTIPALQQNLINSTSLTFPANIVQTGVATASFVLANPFTASINLLRTKATATYQGLNLGEIPNVDLSANPLHAGGHSSVTSPGLPLNFNLDPATIIQLLLLNGKANGVDFGPLASMFQFVVNNPNFKPPVKTSVDPNAATCVSGQQFDVDGAVLKALANLKVDLAVETSVKLDDYATDLTFSQKNVPAITDKTSLNLIGAVAGPVAQNLVDGAVLAFSSAIITNITEGGFSLALKGSLTNSGPLDALISFTEPVTVNWQGKNIAQIVLPPICAAANAGVPNYEANGQLTITDNDAFTEFATFLLHNPSFDWTISTPKLRVTALGTIFDNVSLTKTVSFKAFNGLPGVTISNFQLPTDDPAGGIQIQTDANIPSAAQIGIDLGSVTFQSFFKGTLVGPLSVSSLVLSPSSVTTTHLSGRILPQSGNNVAVLGELFSNFLQGQNQTLQTNGDSVQPPGANGPVSWLSTAFKTVSLDVILPGEKAQVIQAIDLNDLEVVLKTQDQAFAPPASSQNTVAHYKNPFGFSLQVIESGQTIVLGSGGVQIAQLVLPKTPANGGVSTGNVVDLPISFQNIPLQSLNNAAFGQLFSGVTLTADVAVDLTGSADVVARTKIGDIPLSGVPFAVTSHLKGINSFDGTAALSNVKVQGSGGTGGNEFINVPLTTTLQNPSNVSLDTVDISLPVSFNGVDIGRAFITELPLVPGQNSVAAEFHYAPADANDTTAQSFLTEFVTSSGQLDLKISGDSSSSPFGSLASALTGLQLTSQLNGINHPNIITDITVYISLSTLTTNLVEVDFGVFNPLDAPLVIEFAQSDSGVNGLTYARFSESFTSFVVPPGGTARSGTFGNVLLTQGAAASLVIIPLGYLDVQTAVTARIGEGGYQVPFLKLNQNGVPTKYTVKT